MISGVGVACARSPNAVIKSAKATTARSNTNWYTTPTLPRARTTCAPKLSAAREVRHGHGKPHTQGVTYLRIMQFSDFHHLENSWLSCCKVSLSNGREGSSSRTARCTPFILK